MEESFRCFRWTRRWRHLPVCIMPALYELLIAESWGRLNRQRNGASKPGHTRIANPRASPSMCGHWMDYTGREECVVRRGDPRRVERTIEHSGMTLVVIRELILKVARSLESSHSLRGQRIHERDACTTPRAIYLSIYLCTCSSV